MFFKIEKKVNSSRMASSWRLLTYLCFGYKSTISSVVQMLELYLLCTNKSFYEKNEYAYEFVHLLDRNRCWLCLSVVSLEINLLLTKTNLL